MKYSLVEAAIDLKKQATLNNAKSRAHAFKVKQIQKREQEK